WRYSAGSRPAAPATCWPPTPRPRRHSPPGSSGPCSSAPSASWQPEPSRCAPPTPAANPPPHQNPNKTWNPPTIPHNTKQRNRRVCGADGRPQQRRTLPFPEAAPRTAVAAALGCRPSTRAGRPMLSSARGAGPLLSSAKARCVGRPATVNVPVTEVAAAREDVTHVVYVCAFTMPAGTSMLDALGGPPPGGGIFADD